MCNYGVSFLLVYLYLNIVNYFFMRKIQSTFINFCYYIVVLLLKLNKHKLLLVYIFHTLKADCFTIKVTLGLCKKKQTEWKNR